MATSSNIRLATVTDSVPYLTALINNAYKVGEAGIMVDTAKHPFHRMLEADVTLLVQDKHLLVLVLATAIIGCVKVKPNIETTALGLVGEWGGLAVHPDHQHQGYGSLLHTAAEHCLKEHGCIIAQLELLTPSDWKHDHKERLRRWYVGKLGYQLKVPGDYVNSTSTVPSGTLLLGRFLLTTNADFTIYQRRIPQQSLAHHTGLTSDSLMQSVRADLLRKALLAFYTKQAPAEVEKVENIVARVVGGPPSSIGGMVVGGVLWDEEELFAKLEAKYGGKVVLGVAGDGVAVVEEVVDDKPDTGIEDGFEYTVPALQLNLFQDNGFVVLEDVVSPPEIDRYVALLRKMLTGEVSTLDKRGDLGGHIERVDDMVENTVQIIHPYVLTSQLDCCEHFRKGEDIAEQLYGHASGQGRRENWGLDCAQFIVKFPKTKTETPWHQDQSYYPDALVDKRACNIWLALEDCSIESGCMRFIPTPLSCTDLTEHRAAGNGKGALMTDPPNGVEGQVCTPLRAGSVVVFNNYTYHFGGPNQTEGWRPAFVGQFRPKHMIQAARELGFDHGKFSSNEDGSLRTARGK